MQNVGMTTTKKKKDEDAGLTNEADEANREEEAGGKQQEAGRTKRSEKGDSAILLTVSKVGEKYEPFESVTEEEHKGLMEFLETEVDEKLGTAEYIPKVDFSTYKNGRSSIGCTDKQSAGGVRKMTKVFKPGFEAWSRSLL